MAIEAGAPVSAVRVDGSLVYKGAIDAASPPDLTSAKKGDYYKISGAGTLAGVAVQVDDSIIFNQDASSPLTSAMFDVIDSSALGTASAEDVGTAIGDVVQLENVGGSAGLPAVDGSQLQNVTATIADASETVKGAIEIATNVEAAAGSANDKALVPSNVSSLSIGSGQVTGLATVATSGAYSDLSGTPSTATTTVEGIIETATDAEATAGTANDKALTPANIDAISIGQLSDVDLTGISPNDLLAYNSTSGNFEASAPSGVPDASETVKGIIEIATNTEAGAGTANDKALVPSNIASFSIASSQLTGLAAIATSGAYSDLSGVPSASTTVQGIIETATDAEATAGTASDKALTPANIDAISVGQLSDVNLSGVATNNFLKYSGSEFQPTTDGTALTIEVSSDTSPQLGGNLDTAGNGLITTSNADLLLEPNGTGLPKVTGTASRAGGIKFTEATDTYSVSISASNSQSANYSLTLPVDDGIANQLLQTDGSGVLTWSGPHLLVANNLSDLNDAPTARSNLGLGTAAVLDVGTSANNIVQLNGSAQIPALDGSLLTDVIAAPITVSAQSTSFTAAAGNYYRMNPSGSLVVTLPTASAAGDGGEIELKLVTAQTVTINVAAASGDLIDGASSYTLDVQWSAIRLKADGSSVWDVL